MKIEIEIDESCLNCKKELKYFKSLQKRHKGFYANKNMKTYKLLEGIFLSPDYNSEGHLTHFHIIKASKNNLNKIIKSIEISEKESEKITELKRLGLWKLKKKINELKGLKK